MRRSGKRTRKVIATNVGAQLLAENERSRATNVELKGLVETHFYSCRVVVIMMYMYIYTYLYILFRSESSVATPRRVLKGGGAGAMGGFKA